MAHLAFIDIEELDRLILSHLSYDDLKIVLFVSKRVSSLVNDVLWYLKIEQMIGRPIERLTVVPPRLAYRVISLFDKQRETETFGNWVLWRDDPVLFRLANSWLDKYCRLRFYLHLSALRRGHECVKSLIDVNADWFKDAADKEDYIHQDLLIEIANNNEKHYTSDLVDAIMYGYEFLFDWLIDRGADPSAGELGQFEIKEERERYIAFIARRDKRNSTADRLLDQILVSAIQYASYDLSYVSLLLRYGANPACNNYSIVRMSFETAKLILPITGGGENHPHLRAREFAIFRYAAARNDFQLVRWLLELYGNIINVNAANGYALRRAARNGYDAMVTILLEHGADPSVRNYYPIRQAVAKGRLYIALNLLDHTPINYSSIVAPLIIAIDRDDRRLIEKFLKREPVAQYLHLNNHLAKLSKVAIKMKKGHLSILFDAVGRKYDRR